MDRNEKVTQSFTCWECDASIPDKWTHRGLCKKCHSKLTLPPKYLNLFLKLKDEWSTYSLYGILLGVLFVIAPVVLALMLKTQMAIPLIAIIAVALGCMIYFSPLIALFYLKATTPIWHYESDTVISDFINTTSDDKSLKSIFATTTRGWIKEKASKKISDIKFQNAIKPTPQEPEIEITEEKPKPVKRDTRPSDKELLEIIALSNDTKVIKESIQKLRDKSNLLRTTTDENIALSTIKAISDLSILEEFVKETSPTTHSSNIRLAAFKKVKNEALIIDVFHNDEDDKMRLAAIGKIKDRSLLIEIVCTTQSQDIFERVCNKLDESELVSVIEKDDLAEEVKLQVLPYIVDEAQLFSLHKTSESKKIQEHIMSRLNVDTLIENQKYLKHIDKLRVSRPISLLTTLDEKIEAFKTLTEKTAEYDSEDDIMQANFPTLYNKCMQNLSRSYDLDDETFYCDADLIACILIEFEYEDDWEHVNDNKIEIIIDFESTYEEDGVWLNSTILTIKRLTEDTYTWYISSKSRLD